MGLELGVPARFAPRGPVARRAPWRRRRGVGLRRCGAAPRGGAPGHRRQGAAARRLEARSEEHTSELQSPYHLVYRLLLLKNNVNFNLSVTRLDFDSKTMHVTYTACRWCHKRH